MAMWNEQEVQESIEQLIDSTTLDSVLGALVAVCDAKAEHLLSNWQDKQAAAAWRRASNAIYTARKRCDV